MVNNINTIREIHLEVDHYLKGNGFNCDGNAKDTNRNLMVPLNYEKFEVRILIQNQYYVMKNIVNDIQYIGDIRFLDFFKENLIKVTKLEENEEDE